MLSVIIVGILSFIGFMLYTAYKGDFKKNTKSDNVFTTLFCFVMSIFIALGAAVLLTIGSAVYVSEANDPPQKLVDMEGYYLTEIRDGIYVNINSNTYSYATTEDRTIHLSKTYATKDDTVKIHPDVYDETEKPMVFIDTYRIGGTVWLDYFTFCDEFGETTITTFYIPEDTIGMESIEID